LACSSDQEDDQRGAAWAFAVHELKTPITVVSGVAELLDSALERSEDSELHGLLAMLSRSAQRLDRLVEEALLTTRLDAGAVPIQTANVPVLPVLAAAAEVAKVRGVAVEISGSLELRVWTDPGRLEQILSTLVDNSCQYGRPPVTISASSSDSDATITVSDAGRGPRLDDQEDLFIPFSRAASGRNRSHGLGLCSARRLAHLLDGDLLYTTNEAGWSFRVVLPIRSRLAASRA
jgi:signal transduction histidine kinase